MILFIFSSVLLLQAALLLHQINGTDTTIEEYPFMVSLKRGDTHFCGASILSDRWILTAAHCVEGRHESDLTIQVGHTDISSAGDSLEFSVEEFVSHPDYVPVDSFINDIALIKTKKPLKFTSRVQPVKLPSACFEVDQADPAVTLIGWGITNNGVLASTLQKVDYFAVSNEECDQIHADWPIYPTQICAAEPGGGKGQCNGDSGGPLLHNGVQVGIVSWSIKPCTVAPFPGVLTKVSHFVDFIYSNTDLKPAGIEAVSC